MYDVDKIKAIASDLTGGAEDREVLRKLIASCRCAEWEIKRNQSAIFVSINDIGPDDDFTRIYTPLGFMTREEAEKKCEELSDDNFGWAMDGVKEITPEEYDLYIACGHWSTIRDTLGYMRGDEFQDSITREVMLERAEKQLAVLRDKLGFEYRWEVVGEL